MFTPIQLDKSRNFRFGMKALVLIEKKLNVKVTNLDFDNLGIEDMATLIWAGLVHEDKDLTVDKVMDLIDDHSDMQTVFETMNKAFEEAFTGNKKQLKN